MKSSTEASGAIDLSGRAIIRKGFTKNGLKNDLFNIRGREIRLRERKEISARKAKYFLSFSNFADYISSLQPVQGTENLYSLDYQEQLYFLKIENDSQVHIYKH